MKSPILLLIPALLFSLSLRAQRVYYIYVQTEDQQPFFIKTQSKVYSSEPSGYLIISNLKDSTYEFTVGFPGNKYPDQRFSVNMRKSDHGFLLRNPSQKGWVLYDLQTSSTLQPLAERKLESVMMERMEGNAFVDLLIVAADDSSLRYKPILVKNDMGRPGGTSAQDLVIELGPALQRQSQSVTKSAIVKNEVRGKIGGRSLKLVLPKIEMSPKPDSAVMVKLEEKEKTVSPKNERKEEVTSTEKLGRETDGNAKNSPPTDGNKTVAIDAGRESLNKTAMEKKPVEEKLLEPKAVYQPSKVTKRSESSTTEGFGLVFHDTYPDGKTDTIRILIPNSNASSSKTKKDESRPDVKFLDILPADTQQENVVESKTGVKEEPMEEPKVNNATALRAGCKDLASETEFFRLRKRMAAATKDEQMLNEARKQFKLRCFSTEQLRNLSSLFLDDDGKYKFFDESYLYVNDPQNFSTLVTELKEDYYINRFKAMLR